MQYVLKVLIDLEARDDVAARQSAAALVRDQLGKSPGLREIVLHATTDHKSIRINPDGSFEGQWNKGGPAR